MSLLDDIHSAYETVVTGLISKFGPEVEADASALLDTAKTQAGQILATVEADVKADAATVAGDISTLSAEAGQAVNPAPTPPAAPIVNVTA